MDSMKQLIKKTLWTLTRRWDHLRIEVNCDKRWFGNRYGGFFVAESLVSSRTLIYSFGIGEDTSFDCELIKKYNCEVFGFDPTPKSIQWVAKNNLPNNFHFYDFGIGKTSRQENFFLPKNPDHVSGSVVSQSNVTDSDSVLVQLKSLEDTMSELGHDKVGILKMDIEGSEYEVLPGILEADLNIDQILVEFHERFFTDGKSKTKKILALMKAHGFEIFGISPSYEEVSFVRMAALK